jgi:perosamine synthetase
MIVQIEPWIDEEEMIQLKRVISSTYVTEHELTKEFERRIKDLTGSKHAIAMTNGTAALYCCLKVNGIGPGDEVVVPDMTFIATANAVLMAGAVPVFADIDSETLSLSSETVTRVLSKKTKAVMPVHLYGRSANMDDLVSFCKENQLILIEDAAQGTGVRYKGKHVGTFGSCGVLSFYGNKTITCGEGGIVLTDSDYLAKECYKLKNHGREKKGVFIHESVGFNFCFTEMQAAIGIAQLQKLNRIIIRKDNIRRTYYERLSHLAELKLLDLSPDTDHVFWFTSILTDFQEGLKSFLGSRKIQSRRAFYPLHMQPCYQTYELPIRDKFNESKQVYDRLLSLPSSYMLTVEQQDFVCSAIMDFYKHKVL